MPTIMAIARPRAVGTSVVGALIPDGDAIGCFYLERLLDRDVIEDDAQAKLGVCAGDSLLAEHRDDLPHKNVAEAGPALVVLRNHHVVRNGFFWGRGHWGCVIGRATRD